MISADSNTRPWHLTMPVLLLYATCFYVFINWGSIGRVFNYGDLVGPDSFLRLHQVLNWLDGQNWFDLHAYQMAPPEGADIHWSRLVDLPIAALIVLFDVFVPTDIAAWMAAIVWPFLLYISIFWVIKIICERLVDDCHPYIVLVVYCLCFFVMAETAPGRVDHHNVQILLFTLSLLGLTGKPGWFADGLVGVAVSISISVGLDAAALFLPMLALFGVQWALNMEKMSGRLLRIGISLAVSSLVIYAATMPMDRWSDNRCDAYSLFYLSALINLSLGFVSLGVFGILPISGARSTYVRMTIGLMIAGLAAGSLLLLFPHCAGGPLANLDPELRHRWLDTVVEAQGIFSAAKKAPERWFGEFLYVWLCALVGIWVTSQNYKKKPDFLVLLCSVLFCAFGIFFQMRILRTGIVATVPFNVAIVMTFWTWLNTIRFELKVTRPALVFVVCVCLSTVFWTAAGRIALGKIELTGLAANLLATHKDKEPGPIKATRQSCSGKDSLYLLDRFSKGVIMSDLNTATPIMYHTSHVVISGPYHRNARSILSVFNFFGADEETAKTIAGNLGVTHVVVCNLNSNASGTEDSQQLKYRIRFNNLPAWLEWISAPDANVLVMRVVI